MPNTRVLIINKLGLHARAAAKFVGVANQYGCKVGVGLDEESQVDGKSIMQVMMLAASKGTEICISCEGDQADDAMNALLELINDYFGEGEQSKLQAYQGGPSTGAINCFSPILATNPRPNKTPRDSRAVRGLLAA